MNSADEFPNFQKYIKDESVDAVMKLLDSAIQNAGLFKLEPIIEWGKNTLELTTDMDKDNFKFHFKNLI